MVGGLRRLIGSRVVIHTKDDQSLRGVLLKVYRDSVKLDAPEYLAEAQPTNLPGYALIERANVSWYHELGG